PSGEVRLVALECMATVGQVGNLDHENVSIGKAGRVRWKGFRPTVRGSVMNPVDHPMGGGEGKGKGNHPMTPWGKPTKGYKARLVLDQIRGKAVGEALATLTYTPRAAARLIEKVLRSAVANAEHNHQVRNLDDLRVVRAIADGGPSMKRVQPRAMGRAFFIKHRTSHLTIAVSDEA